MDTSFEDRYGINHSHEPLGTHPQQACRTALIDIGFWLKDSIFWFYDVPTDAIVRIGLDHTNSFKDAQSAVTQLRNGTNDESRLVVLSILARKLSEAEARWRKEVMRGNN